MHHIYTSGLSHNIQDSKTLKDTKKKKKSELHWYKVAAPPFLFIRVFVYCN